VRTPTFSVEVITLPVSDVERALRFYVDQVVFTLDVHYRPNDAFRVVQLTPPGSSCSSRSATDSPTRPSVQSATSISSSRTWRPRGAACSNVGSRSVRSGTRCPSVRGTEVSRPGSTQRAETMPASLTSLIRMTTAGCYRNGATGMRDVLWKPNLGEDWRKSIPRNKRCEVWTSRRPAWSNSTPPGSGCAVPDVSGIAAILSHEFRDCILEES